MLEFSDSTPRAAAGWRWGAWLSLVLGLLLFAPTVWGYVADAGSSQSHFAYLWGFAAVALWRNGGLGFRGRFGGWSDARSAFTAAVWAFAVLAFYAGSLTGSGVAERVALTATVTALTLGSFGSWSIPRCLSFSALLLLCFGLPYSVYFSISSAFRGLFLWILQLPPELGLLGYQVEGSSLVYPHYRLDIISDCSGFTQLVMFLGLAFVGVFVSRPDVRRASALFVGAAALAVVANAARLLFFATVVDFGWTAAIDRPWLHEVLGLAAYLPFVAVLVWWMVRTHRPRPAAVPIAPRRRGLPMLAFAIPFAVAWLVVPAEPVPAQQIPASFAGVDAPPGYTLAAVAGSEVREHDVYATPWLVNRRYVSAGEPGRVLDVFAYATRSRGHLNVHQISNCLEAGGEEVRYGPSIAIDGRTFWAFELVGGDEPWHGYFAFHLDGADFDDRAGTRLEVFLRRLSGQATEICLTRFLMPGPLQVPIPDEDREILAWRARQLSLAAPD